MRDISLHEVTHSIILVVLFVLILRLIFYAVSSIGKDFKEITRVKQIPSFEEHKIVFMEDRVVAGSVHYSTNHNGKYVPGSLSRDREVAYRIYESYVKSVNNKDEFVGKKVIESTTVKRPI